MSGGSHMHLIICQSNMEVCYMYDPCTVVAIFYYQMGICMPVPSKLALLC